MKKGLIADIIRKFIICICIVIFLISAYELYKIFSEYNKNTNVYEEIKEVVPTIKTENYIAKEEFENLKLQNEEYSNYINEALSKSFFSFDVKDIDKGKIITLTTCTNVTEEERLIVHGKLIDS